MEVKVIKDVEEEIMNRPKKMSSHHLLLQGRNEKSMHLKLFSHPIKKCSPMVLPWLQEAKDAARIAKKTVKVVVKKFAEVDNAQTDKIEVNSLGALPCDPPDGCGWCEGVSRVDCQSLKLATVTHSFLCLLLGTKAGEKLLGELIIGH